MYIRCICIPSQFPFSWQILHTCKLKFVQLGKHKAQIFLSILSCLSLSLSLPLPLYLPSFSVSLSLPPSSSLSISHLFSVSLSLPLPLHSFSLPLSLCLSLSPPGLPRSLSPTLSQSLFLSPLPLHSLSPTLSQSLFISPLSPNSLSLLPFSQYISCSPLSLSSLLLFFKVFGLSLFDILL